MRAELLVALIAVLISSGCAGSSPAESKKDPEVEDILEGRNSTYNVSYSIVSGVGDVENNTLSFLIGDEDIFIRSERETPGGLFRTRTYVMEDGLVVCREEPSPGDADASCQVGDIPIEHLILLPDRWNSSFEYVRYRDEGCEDFRGSTNNLVRTFSPLDVENLTMCLEKDSGLLKEASLKTKRGSLRIKLEEKKPLTGKAGLNLERTVGIVGHCQGSNEVDLTSFEDLTTAVLSVNGNNRTVVLPPKFETRSARMPARFLESGENRIAVYAGGKKQVSICYRN